LSREGAGWSWDTEEDRAGTADAHTGSGRIECKFYDPAGQECGAIPGDKVVVVVDGSRGKTRPSANVYRPADLYLNG